MIEVVPFSSEHQAGVIDAILPIQQLEFGMSITLEDEPDLRDIPEFYQRDGETSGSRLCDGWIG
jgi:hypothetical protein